MIAIDLVEAFHATGSTSVRVGNTADGLEIVFHIFKVSQKSP